MSAEADKPQQSKSLFVMNVEGKRTTGPLLIGLLDYFQRWLPNVGYFEVRSRSPHSNSRGELFKHGCWLSCSRLQSLLVLALHMQEHKHCRQGHVSL